MKNNNLIGDHDISFDEALKIIHCTDNIPDVTEQPIEMDSFTIENGVFTQVGGDISGEVK